MDSDLCLRFEEEAVSFVLGDLDGAVRAQLISHLDACSPCRREVAAVNAAVDAISASTAPLEPVPGFVERVLASAEDQRLLAPPPTARSRTPLVVMRRRRTLLSLSAAAALLTVVGVGLHSWALSSLGVLAAVLAVAYLALIAAITHARAGAELEPVHADDVWWRGLDPLGSSEAPPGDDLAGPDPVALDNTALVRFAISYFTGWLLTPVVGAIAVVRGDLSGVEQSPVVGRIVALQRQGRAQSLRLLAAGVTTVAVAGGGAATATILLAPQVASAAPATPTYVVRPGDTLSAIAQRYHVSVATLARLNGISDPNLIFAGQVLRLGTAGSPPPAPLPVAVRRYTVQLGDTLDAIAARFGTTGAALAAVNRLSDPNLIVVGQVLTIPHGSVGAGTSDPHPTAARSGPATPSSPPAPAPASAGYINPFAQGSWSPARIDEGVDWIPNAPSPVVAIGDGVITYSSMASGWPGGAFISYRLTGGSHAGLSIYVAEHLSDLLPAGTVVRAGERIATARPGYPWTEWGWASAYGPAPAPGSQYNGAPDGTPTAGGKAFARFLLSLGVTGVQDPGPGPTRP